MVKFNGNRIFLLAAFLILAAFASRLPQMPQEARGYPAIVLVGAAVLDVYLFIRGGEVTSEVLEASKKKLIFSFVALVFAYYYLLGKIGYILATMSFLYVLFLLLRLKSKKVFIFLTPIVTLLLYFFFTRVLSVILPEGTWFNIYL